MSLLDLAWLKLSKLIIRNLRFRNVRVLKWVILIYIDADLVGLVGAFTALDLLDFGPDQFLFRLHIL